MNKSPLTWKKYLRYYNSFLVLTCKRTWEERNTKRYRTIWIDVAVQLIVVRYSDFNFTLLCLYKYTTERNDAYTVICSRLFFISFSYHSTMYKFENWSRENFWDIHRDKEYLSERLMKTNNFCGFCCCWCTVHVTKKRKKKFPFLNNFHPDRFLCSTFLCHRKQVRQFFGLIAESWSCAVIIWLRNFYVCSIFL